jgi:uncharacterized MAPEG superfamily protein
MRGTVTTDLRLLAATLVLALVQLLAAAVAKRRQDGWKWAGGPRDTPPPAYTGVAGRLQRAQANLMETLPIFAVGIMIAHVAGRNSALSTYGAQAYFWSRLAYVPLYAMGFGLVRTAAWGVGIVGVAMVLAGLC